jgi:hypothetical protein
VALTRHLLQALATTESAVKTVKSSQSLSCWGIVALAMWGEVQLLICLSIITTVSNSV